MAYDDSGDDTGYNDQQHDIPWVQVPGSDFGFSATDPQLQQWHYPIGKTQSQQMVRMNPQTGQWEYQNNPDYAAPTGDNGGGGGATDYGTDAGILAQIAKWAAMPGADPSLKNDPNYWLGAIKSKGGLNAGNLQYWQDASVGPTAFFNNPNRESGTDTANKIVDSANTGDWFSANAPSPASYQQLARPDSLSQPYVPKQFTEQFTAPTMDDLKNSAGYQAGADLLQKGLERGAAAKGSILSGGFAGIAEPRALANYAGTAYNNLFGQAYDTYQQKYKQFQDSQNADLTARGLNENTYQTDLGNNLNTYKTRYAAYQDAINNNFNLANLGLNATQAGNPGQPL